MSAADAPDVVVIGGGIVGVSSAAHLAAAGARVVLIERTAIAAGASGRNSGVVQHPFDPVLVGLHLGSLTLYRALAEVARNGFALPDAPAGLLYVGRDEVGARRIAAELESSHPALTPVYLAPDDLRRLEPSLAPDLLAVRVGIGYPVAPAAATHASAEWATGLGVEIRTGTAARPSVASGRVVGVDLDDGSRIATDTVLVAAGPWTSALIDPTGAWRPIRSIWGVVVSVALPDAPTHVLEEMEIEIEPRTGAGDDDGEDTVAGVAFSLVPATGASSLGSTFFATEPEPGLVVPALLERGERFIPGLARASVGPHRVCSRPQSRDGRPLLGAVPGIDGLWVAAGHGPWGISTGPASGRLVADLIVGRQSAPPPAVDPGRFEAPLQ